MAFAVGIEIIIIMNLEGGILTPNQTLRFDLRGLLLLEKVFSGASRALRS